MEFNPLNQTYPQSHHNSIPGYTLRVNPYIILTYGHEDYYPPFVKPKVRTISNEESRNFLWGQWWIIRTYLKEPNDQEYQHYPEISLWVYAYDHRTPQSVNHQRLLNIFQQEDYPQLESFLAEQTIRSHLKVRLERVILKRYQSELQNAIGDFYLIKHYYQNQTAISDYLIVEIIWYLNDYYLFEPEQLLILPSNLPPAQSPPNSPCLSTWSPLIATLA